METIEERANRMADWIFRRESMLKACNLPKLLKEMLEEQKAIDIERVCEWLEEHPIMQGYHDHQCYVEDFCKAMEEEE